MDIIFYHNSADEDHITKVLDAGYTLTGTLRNESSIIRPTIRIEWSDSFTYNYCYIEEWDRYYYIDEIVSLRNEVMELSLRVDPLMSFKNDILDLNVIINKQDSSNINLYLDDGDWVMENKMFNEIYTYENGFNDTGEFILIVAGA